MSDLSARRPLKSRSSQWAASLSRLLLRCRATPNQVSVASACFACLGATAMVFSGRWGFVGWILAAVCIQLRLICNLMDGMLAVEGGLKTPNGDLYNEFPDRLSDMVILACLGHAEGSPLGIVLGWMAACGALMTAGVRLHGASLTGQHDFRGPMAKPQRMALVTVACLVVAALQFFQVTGPVLIWSLGLMVVGIAITVGRRLSALSDALRKRQLSQS